MLIRVEKDWSYPDLRRQTPSGSGCWGDLQVTFDPVPECDLLIVLNCPNRDIRVRVPPGNKWLFSQESPVPMYRWHLDSFRYFDKVFTFWGDESAACVLHDQTSLPWHIGRSFDELSALTLQDSLAHKRDAVSWVTSNATHKEGHKLRMSLKDHLIAEGFAFDLFGRGFSPIEDKFDGIFPYKYSLAIENYACNDYWTEKLADCFLSWTVPIYWGAQNIRTYFPEKSMIHIDPSDPASALAIIREAMDSDYFGAHGVELAEARELVLRKYQFFPHVEGLLRDNLSPIPPRKERVYIPANPRFRAGVGKLDAIKQIIRRMPWIRP